MTATVLNERMPRDGRIMKVLLTGGAGFIGAWTVRRLLDDGAEVRVAEPAETNLANMEGVGAEVVTADVRDTAGLRRAAEGCRWIFHLAAFNRFWAQDKSIFEEVNVQGTANVLSAARTAGVERVVHVSSATILKRPRKGEGDESELLDEKKVKDHYEGSKLAAEHLALKAARSGLDVVIANPTVPVGPGDVNLTAPGKMIVDFTLGKIPAYMNSGFNAVDVRDAADGLVLTARKGVSGERYILGGSNVSQKELFAILAELTGRKAPKLRIPYVVALATAHVSEFMSDRVTHKEPLAPLGGVRASKGRFFFDHEKAARELGYSPSRSLEDSLREALVWFRENGLLPAAEVC